MGVKVRLQQMQLLLRRGEIMAGFKMELITLLVLLFGEGSARPLQDLALGPQHI